MKIVDRLLKPTKKAGGGINAGRNHALEKMPQGHQKAREYFNHVHPQFTPNRSHNRTSTKF
jgi:hypothetical protein